MYLFLLLPLGVENVSLNLNPYHKSANELQAEQVLVLAAQANPLRFGVLYECYFKQVFVFVHRRLDDEEQAADIVSQVFLKALINLHKYEYRGVPFSAWLFRIALNEINMYFRKNKSHRVVSIEKNDLQLLAEETGEENKAENEQKIMKALALLPEGSMQLVELRFFEKRSFAEMGTILGITENNAKVKLYRVIDKLKQLIIPRK